MTARRKAEEQPVSTPKATKRPLVTALEVENDLINEVKAQACEYLKPNIQGIVNAASPSDAKAKGAATRTTNSIAKLVEALFNDKSLLKAEYQKNSKKRIRDWLARSPSPKPTAAKVNSLFSLFSQFQRLVPVKSKTDGSRNSTNETAPKTAVKNERQVYNSVKALISVISECVRLQANPKMPPKRLIQPFKKTDVHPKDSEHDWRVDIALKCTPLEDTSPPCYVPKNSAVKDPAELEDRPELADTFAFIERKRHETEMDDTYARLFSYTKEIYMAQHDRRFIWGMVMCNTTVHACIFGPNYAAASKDMRLTTGTGRKNFIRLFVNWSFCDSSKLGYDPTTSYDYKLQCLVIQAVSSDNKETKAFYSREVVICAERLFGRHTRCFKATADRPSPPDENDPRKPHEQMDCNIFIKDAWSEALESADEDDREEARHLKKSICHLKDITNVKDMYPELYEDCVSGRVRFTDPELGRSYEDNSKTVLGADV
ncbi:hypothetical protein IW140_004999 [Coemansia sp. RSA 1813]|nr:hypothetical protein IW140_004999 [Coemansia sp. RSA 1813]